MSTRVKVMSAQGGGAWPDVCGELQVAVEEHKQTENLMYYLHTYEGLTDRYYHWQIIPVDIISMYPYIIHCIGYVIVTLDALI